ncbi:MAG: endonuclease/exonuclease/phosphatase family protein [Candidatus Eisenbacteria bacterium]|nr:endonuclease/exonuclease/phosphatase family protein [Candidatus Eisenbacteria bacterium]
MRIITWNMGCGPRQYREHHDKAWDYVLQDLKPDVAFVQEALVPKLRAMEELFSIFLCPPLPDHDSGTAVLVAKHLGAGPGPTVTVSGLTYVATATVDTPAGPLTVASFHVYPDDNQKEDLPRIVELARSEFARSPAVFGGDFNCARKFGGMYARFFEAMGTAGFCEPCCKDGKEGWSFWGRQAKEKYQDDHFFVSESWAPRVQSCQTINEGVVRTVSDHGPVVLELDVG